MKPKFDTDFEYDEWVEKMREHQVLNGYFLDKNEVDVYGGEY